MVKITGAQPWMIKALYGHALEHTVEAIVAMDGDTVLGMAALYPQNGRLMLAVRITPPARAALELHHHCRTLLRAAAEILRRAACWNLPVQTVADTRYAGAIALLEHLKFKHVHRDIYEWSAHG